MNSGVLRRIGSDFEAPSDEILFPGMVDPPWKQKAEATVLVQTGRGALRLISRALRADGYQAVMVPSYACDSMIRPFFEDLWQIVPLPVEQDASLDPERVADALGGVKKKTALLFAEYFGRSPSSDMTNVLTWARDHGLLVIHDKTHQVYTSVNVPADVSFGSLRKLLPVADGAFISSSRMVILPEEETENTSGLMRWEAMDRLQRFDEDPDKIRNAHIHANEALEALPGTGKPTERSAWTLSHLNYELLAERRVGNARALSSFLDGVVDIINPPVGRTLPSHLVIRVPDAKRAQAFCAARQVFCPIHWPQTSLTFSHYSWPNDLLSLPVDHRYDDTDMRRVADAVIEWVIRGGA